MLNRICVKAAVFTFIAASLASCGATRGEYDRFAQAGNSYATAIDTLLVASSKILVDANSERLLRSHVGKPEIDRISYEEVTQGDEQWLVLTSRMRTHTAILKRYFALLEQLSTSDASEHVGEATGEIVTELTNIGQKIRTAKPVSNQVGQDFGSIVIKAKINGALRQELELRKDVIQQELSTQDLVLKLLTTKLRTDLKDIQENQDTRFTFNPYVATKPIANPDDWINKRRLIRTMSMRVEELQNASNTSDDFKEAFKALLENKLTIERANALLSEIESLSTVAEDLKK